MEAFELDDVRRDQQERGERYLQFINQGSLSLGLYVLPAGGTDVQTPHAEDEVYYVVSGHASVNVDGVSRPVQPGSMIFVAKDVEHRFFDIEEELSLLVFFAPQHAG
jgi:mannose-6-phosphate isomerase-like protein (cupin superfamily)